MTIRSDGELMSGGTGRWCETCGITHGPLYRCEHFSLQVKGEIDVQSSIWHEQLRHTFAAGHSELATAMLAALTGVYATRRDQDDRGRWFA